MKVNDNKVKTVARFIREELKSSCSEREVNGLMQLTFGQILGFSRTDLVSKAEQFLTESELLQFFRVVKELKRHKPIQYILGETEFYGMKLLANENAMIPRPETEELVDWIVKSRKQVKKSGLNIIDIGTGSGCIAIALKKHLPGASVSALDVSLEAIALAKQNAKLNSVALQFIQADILDETMNGSNAKFNLVVSNPPYVLLSEKDALDKNVTEYEPHLALFVNEDAPLIFYRAIIRFCKNHLAEKGMVYCEINERFGKEVSELFNESRFTDVMLKKDINGRDRMISATMK